MAPDSPRTAAAAATPRLGEVQPPDHAEVPPVRARPQRRVPVHEDGAPRVQQGEFGARHAVRGELAVRVGEDLLDEAEVGEVGPDADQPACLVAHRRGEDHGEPVLARGGGGHHLGPRRRLDHGAGEAGRAGQELAAHGLAEPGRAGEGAGVERRGGDLLARGVAAARGENRALGVDQQGELVDAVGGDVVVHGAHEGVVAPRAAPVGRVVRRGVQPEGLHVAVALEQAAVDGVGQRGRGVGHAAHGEAAQRPPLHQQGAAEQQGRRQPEAEQEEHDAGADRQALDQGHTSGGTPPIETWTAMLAPTPLRWVNAGSGAAP
jgi:hypothetical protein